MSLNLAFTLRASSQNYPTAIAAICGETRRSYSELHDAARRFAGDLLARGLRPGDRVAMIVPNVPEFSVAYFGILYAGGVVVSLSTLLVANEIAFQLEDSEAAFLVVHEQCAPPALAAFERVVCCRQVYMIGGEPPADGRRLEHAAREGEPADIALCAADDTAVIMYTSGTTGKPKGAELTHVGLYLNAQLVAERIFSTWPDEIRALGPGDVGLAVLPLYHSFGQTNIQNALLMAGGAISYVPRFTAAAAAEILIRDRVTFFAGVPTMYIGLLNEPGITDAHFRGLKYCVSGGAPLPIEVKEQFFERFGLRIQEGYGLTETSPLASIQRPRETAKAGTIGKPVAGVEMKVVDADDQELPAGERGEILIRGHNIMKGYFKRPEATEQALRGGWFHSGDVGYVDEDGDFRIVDRQKDLIIRGGYNVYPREVEEALYAHPAVAEAAVIGVPHPRLGEEVKAVVALRAGCTATADEIIAHCKELVAAFKYPRTVEIIDSLPKGPTGKILKRALRDQSGSAP